jgi:hypothetical protein
VVPILVINFVVMVVRAVREPSLTAAWAALVALAIPAGLVLCRFMVLRVQDRVIRLEERLRLERLLPGQHADIENLSRRQLLAIRFASDAEVPRLMERIAAGEIGTKDEIMRAVQHWRPDHLRA